MQNLNMNSHNCFNCKYSYVDNNMIVCMIKGNLVIYIPTDICALHSIHKERITKDDLSEM